MQELKTWGHNTLDLLFRHPFQLHDAIKSGFHKRRVKIKNRR